MFQKFTLTPTIVMVVNLKPMFGFMSEIKKNKKHPKSVSGHNASPMRFDDGQLLDKLDKYEGEIYISILT